MKISKIIVLVLALSFIIPPVNAADYGFKGYLKTEVLSIDKENIKLKVIEFEKTPEGSFPVGTVISGDVTEHKLRRRPTLDEVIKVHITKAQLPSGTSQSLDHYIKIKPKDKLDYIAEGGGLGFLAAGVVLGLTVDLLTLGLPVGRGGLAVWTAVTDTYDRNPSDSKWKAATGGFIRGALIPVGHLFFKGDYLYVEPGTKIYLGKERPNWIIRSQDKLGRVFTRDKIKYIHADVIKRANKD